MVHKIGMQRFKDVLITDAKKQQLICPPFFILYKDGSISRLRPDVNAPLCDDPQAPVRSKDVVIQPETGVSARLFLPKITDPNRKLPVVIYIHGGAFCIGSPRSIVFHNFISTLVEKANFIVVSVDYRLAPEHPFSATYDDSWAAFQWNDPLKKGAMDYYEGLKKSEWKGEVDIMETKGEGHCFHFFNPMSEKAVAIVDKLVGFLKQGAFELVLEYCGLDLES
ncbi:putative carboxylesterase 1-like [Capsicum annuum]|nr:putative carboxylesterase 1-like [Capsicum annuum]KAF3656907.1 putative carboxylesterase 1-like [Capsicum annuum]